MTFSRPQGIRPLLGGAQILFAILPLVWLVAAVGRSASFGFEASPNAYPRPSYEAEDASQYLLDFWGRTRRGIQGRVVAFLGVADEPESNEVHADSPAIQLALQLRDAGAILRICDPNALEHAKMLTDNQGAPLLHGVSFVNDPIEALRDADSVLLATEHQVFLDIPPSTIASHLLGKGVFDGRDAFSAVECDAAQLNYFSFAKPSTPPWLDPDLRHYSEWLQSETDPYDSILFLPGGFLGTTAGRARWFLHMNYQLAPRRLYLWRPDLASGTSGQYRSWVDAYNKERPWKKMGRPRPKPRLLSALPNNTPVRHLHPSEMKAAKLRDIDWVQFWVHNSDFRITDWELTPIEDVKQGGQQ